MLLFTDDDILNGSLLKKATVKDYLEHMPQDFQGLIKEEVIGEGPCVQPGQSSQEDTVESLTIIAG